MILVSSIILSVLIGYAYMRKGLFAGALMLVSVVLGAVTALAFGAQIADMTKVYEQTTYAFSIGGLFILTFGIVRGTFAFIDEEVDFHPLVEHIGGALTGLASGLLVCGLVSICLACMPTPKSLEFAEQSIQQSTQLALKPCQIIWKLVGARRPFEMEDILAAGGSSYSIYQPPPPPPPPETQPAERSALKKDVDRSGALDEDDPLHRSPPRPDDDVDDE